MRGLRTVALTGLATLLLITGCGQPSMPAGAPSPGTSSGSPDAGETSGVLPTLPVPSGAPSTPSDLVPQNILAGTIAVSQGSCHTLRTDDGDQYALVGDVGGTFPVGRVVRAQIDPDTTPTAVPGGCVGTPVTVVKIEMVG